MGNVAMIGHNNSPTDAELLRDYLQNKAALLIEEAENLAEEAAALPAELNDNSEAEELTDFVSMVNDCNKRIEEIRKAEKEPHLTAGKTVDSFFKKYSEKLDGAKQKANKPLTAWLIKQQRLEAERLAAEAERKRAEAAELAASATTEEELDAAIAVDKAAQTIEREVDSGKNLTATRGSLGGTSLMTRWVGEATDKTKIDWSVLAPYLQDEAIQKAINSFVSGGGRTLCGVTIYEKSTAVTRS